jgi:hypothetical protein
MSVKIVGMKQLAKKIDHLPAAMQSGMSNAFRTATSLVENDAKDRAPKGRTPQLASSINHFFKTLKGMIVGSQIGSNLAYAAIQELGGTVPGEAGGDPSVSNLAIPLPGVQGYPRDYSDTIVVQKKGSKRKVIAQIVGKSEIKPLFVLVPKSEGVEIPAQPYLEPALSGNKRAIKQIISAETKKALAFLASGKTWFKG